MDARSLQELWQGPSPFLAQMGEQVFNQAQEKQKADLASVLGQEQRAQQKHPLDMDATRANIRQSDAAAGYNNALSGKLNEELKVLQQVPISDRVNSHVAKMKSELSEADMKRTDAEMETLLGAAAAAAQNKGTLPLGYTLQNPQHAEYFKTPQGATLAMQIAKSYFMQKPKELYAASNDARQAASNLAVAQVQARNRLEVKNAGGDGPAKELPKTYGEVVAAMAKYKKASERLAYLKTILPGVSEQLQAALQPSYDALKIQADEEANARNAGQVDIAATTRGKVPVTPRVNLGNAPSAVANRPARQAATERITIYKDGKPVGTIPIEQKAQALQQGYTTQ